MGAKQTAQLIPLCHNIPLDKVSVELSLDSCEQCVHIEANAKTQGHTGAVIVPCFLLSSLSHAFFLSQCAALTQPVHRHTIVLIMQAMAW